MVRKLFDICMTTIEKNLKFFSSLHIKIPNQVKEKLLYRLVIHSRLTVDQQPYITYNLFAQTLNQITFTGTDQISDNILNLLTQCECKLSYFCVEYSSGFTLKALRSFLSTQDKLESVTFRKINLPASDDFINAFQSEQLQQVSFDRCDFITDDVLISLSSHSPNLINLKLNRVKNITDRSLTTLFSNCNTQLKHVKLVKLSSVTEESITAMAFHCPKIETVTLECLPNMFKSPIALQQMDRSILKLDISLNTVPKQVFNQLFIGNWQLKTLNIIGLELAPIHVNEFAKCFSKLEDLMICGNLNFNDANLESLLKQIGGQLKSFDYLLAPDASDNTASLITQYCTELEKLSLTFNLTGAGLMPLLVNPFRALKLTHLELTACRTLSVQVLDTIFRNCLNLEKLYLRGVIAVDDTSVLSIANNLQKLKYISFRGCSKIRQEDSIIALVLSCPHLKLLGLSGQNFLSDRCIHVIAENLHDLEELYMEGCYGVTRAALNYLTSNSSIFIYIAHNIL